MTTKTPSWNDIRKRATAFAAEWATATDERAQSQLFWVEFFAIFSIDFKRVAQFEAHARRVTTGNRGRIDVFWPRVLLCEHKSAGKDLAQAEHQALDYLDSIDASEQPKAIITSDFANIRLLDLENGGEAITLKTSELANEIERFGFIIGYKKPTFQNEDEANVQAARLMGKLYEELSKDGYEGHEASILLTRLLFLLFGDDTGMWQRGLLTEFIAERTDTDGSDLGPQLSLLFQELDKPEAKRSQSLDDYLKRFPYVNGGLFKERLDIPTFDRRMRDQLLEACRFDWGNISPAVFGSLFQTIKTKEARRELGEHYTPEKFILRTIGPLFLDDLKDQVAKAKDNAKQLNNIREQLRKQSYLDPACGCGNFLIVAYKELRAIELEILKHLDRLKQTGTQLSTDPTEGLAVTLDQFFGIEIEEWPARIAETAMFLADHQSNVDLAKAFGEAPDRLPITQSATIHIGNALQSNWSDVCKIDDNTFIFGNPPYMGKFTRGPQESQDLRIALEVIKGNADVDYVCAWFVLAAKFSYGTKSRFAFVSTNSIAMGEQPAVLWKSLKKYDASIVFAHRTFAWATETPGAAAVHVVIIGIQTFSDPTPKRLFTYASIKSEPVEVKAKQINAYLIDGPLVLITSLRKPLNVNAPKMSFGSMPNDGGNLLLTELEADEFRKSFPPEARFLRPILGAKEMIQGIKRFCIWLDNATPSDLKESPEIYRRVSLVKEERLRSTRLATQKLAASPQLFAEIRQPNTAYIAVPSISSETRNYIPIAVLDSDVIANNKLLTIAPHSLYTFGILNSSIFNIWNRSVSGRMKSDFQVSIEITYNNFPWPPMDSKFEKAVSESAEAIITARSIYPTESLANLYDTKTCPKELADAHRKNDTLVASAYGLSATATEIEITSALFKRYEELTAG
jgi:type I restriction-modification system DNA methylase subunit